MAKNPRIIELAGQRFGKWRVIAQNGNSPGGGAIWSCVCDCGVKRDVIGGDLRHGKSQSCGCDSTMRIAKLNQTHGQSSTRLYCIWKNMRARCSNKRSPGYCNYGGRGITVCEEWSDYSTFAKWAKAAGYEATLSIERMDVNGNYCPENCTWATAAEQSANRRFVQRAPDGELWWHKARANGVTRAAYNWRRKKGWPMDLVIKAPLRFRPVKNRRGQDGRFLKGSGSAIA